MEITAILNLLTKVSKEIGTSTPYLCGGIPRDKALNQLSEIEDLDITTGDKSVHELAKAFATALPESHSKVMGDGHIQSYVDAIKVDFSSSYTAPGIRTMLKRAGVQEPSHMLMELFSRDFTVNSMLMTLDLKTIKDPTGLGMNDIKARRLRTCLPARMTLGDDNKRVVRVLYLAAKLGFEVDEEIIEWVKKNPSSIANVKPRYLAERLQKALNYDEKKTVELISVMGLWNYVPPLPALVPYIGKHLAAT